MARLIVRLYDAVGDAHPFREVSDEEAREDGIVDLNSSNDADKAARVVVLRGPDYVPGDHIALLDEVQTADTDMLTVDPLVVEDLDLNLLDFADRTAALLFVLNPGRQFRLRLDLHDEIGQPAPNLSLYDWQFPDALDLNVLHFARKAARVTVSPGGQFHPGDHIRLFAGVRTQDVDTVTADPLVADDVDLNGLAFADRVEAVSFQLNPSGQFRLRVDLYDQTGRPIPHFSLYDWQTGPATFDLNNPHFADKAARVVISPGAGYHQGDHVRLLDEVRSVDTDMVGVDPLVKPDVDLNSIGFADRAAALEFQLNPGPQFRLRIHLHDALAQVAPNNVLYDWQVHEVLDLNRLHLADKVARVVIAKGGAYHLGDHVRLLDDVRSIDTDVICVDPLVAQDVNLNLAGFADRAAAVEFQLNPGTTFAARADLYDAVDSPLPTIVLYDWQQAGQRTDLNRLHFADKAASIQVSGPNTMVILPITGLQIGP